MKRTEQQQRTIDAPPGNILVSAAAGSGKTSVMTERIVKRIIAGELDIRNVLVMTFTDAAAKSMRDKIQKLLREALTGSGDAIQKSYISKQLVYLPSSQISTIHAFCLDVIRNFYYEATGPDGQLLIEPGFRIEDKGETAIMLNDALDDIFEKYYEECDTDPDSATTRDFLFLVDAFGSQKDDLPLRALLISIYHFLRSMPDYLEWIEKQRLALDQAICDFDESIYYKSLYEGLVLRVDNAKEGMDEFRSIISAQPCFYLNDKKNESKNREMRAFLVNLHQYLDKVIETVNSRDGVNICKWDDLYRLFQTKPDIPVMKKYSSDTEEKTAFMELFATHFAELLYYTSGECGTKKYASQFLYSKTFVFTKSKEEIAGELSHMKPAIWQIFRILEELDSEYTSRKHEANMIDFSDFEHIALKILKSSQAGSYYSDKFQEIYIDEYQDTSSIQEAIMKQITKNNCFMVGDIKQSIYRFRHARPQIFNDKRAVFDADKTCGTVYELNRNFRSVEGILNAVNDVFYQLMSPDAGEIDYDCDQALVAHRENLPETPDPVELLLVDVSADNILGETSGDDESETTSDGCEPGAANDDSENDNEDETSGNEVAAGNGDNGNKPSEAPLTKDEKKKYEKEALAVALKIRELLADGKTSPRDIAILSRTRNICSIFAQTLESIGIPVEQEQTDEFLESYELKIMESLLTILDNPMQDIPLVSVMRSPAFNEGFDEDELLSIRISGSGKKYFYECCEYYRTSGTDQDLKAKIDRFYKWLSDYRERLVYMTVSELIETVYIETGLLEFAAKMPDGLKRVSSLQQFQDWARDFDNTRRSGLYSFVRYMESIHEKSQDQSPFGIEDSQTDAVKVMTMHKSKGLEYEIVFLVGNNRAMSSKDANLPVLVSEESGIGFFYVNVEEQYKYPTPLIFAMKEGMRNAELAEEMRLLYVGMTRAMGRLFISGVCDTADIAAGKGLSPVIEKVRKSDPLKPLPPHIVLSAKNTLEWIIMSIARNPFVDLTPLGISSIEDDSGTNCRFYSKSWSVSVRRYADLLKAYDLLSENTDRPEESQSPVDAAEDASMPPDESVYDFSGKFFYDYPFGDAVQSPLKVTVSEIKRREQAMEPEQIDELVMQNDRQKASMIRGINTTMKELAGTGKTKLESNEIGIAVHSFFRYMDSGLLMENPDEQNIIRHLDKMCDFGMIDKTELGYLKDYAGSFKAYLQSDLAKRIFAAGKKSPDYLFREIPFTIKIKCKTLFGGKNFQDDDFTMVQGMIDCWFTEDGDAVLVDYKTDRIKGTDEQITTILNDRYKTQLAIYAIAIEQAAGRKVKESAIWLVDGGKAYSIDIKDAMARFY